MIKTKKNQDKKLNKLIIASKNRKDRTKMDI